MQIHDDGDLRLAKFGPLGPWANNAYVISDKASGEAVIVDAPSGSQAVLDYARDLRITAILITHSHPDHWVDLNAVKRATGAPIFCHPDERPLSGRIDQPLSDGDEIRVGRVTVRSIHTPGHTPGSACFLAGRFLIAGDTLFPGGPGHTLTPEDLQQTIASITGRLYVLPDDTLVLPGHGGDTTIGESKREFQAFASRSHPLDLCGDVLWEG